MAVTRQHLSPGQVLLQVFECSRLAVSQKCRDAMGSILFISFLNLLRLLRPRIENSRRTWALLQEVRLERDIKHIGKQLILPCLDFGASARPARHFRLIIDLSVVPAEQEVAGGAIFIPG